MKIAITGASGYIGQRLIKAACEAGHEVLALSRRPIVTAGVAWQAFDLADTTPLTLPADVVTVVHLAAETQTPQGNEARESAAAKRLIDAAANVQAGFVFVSSQTAREDAPTPYGQIKWRIERMTLAAGGCVVRPGQVYGGPEAGLFGVLCNLVRRLPVVPAFFPAPLVQPVHVDDLARALLSAAAQPPASLYGVASSEGVTFTKFLQTIAQGRTHRRPVGVPVPTLAIRLIATLLGPKVSGKLGLDRLNSLFQLPRMDTKEDLQRLSITLRPLSAGATRSGHGRRHLLNEGIAVLTYLLRSRPTGSLVRRYVRAIESLRTPQALQLPRWIHWMPFSLALLEGRGNEDSGFRSELGRRIDACLMLAEASPQGARRFLGAEGPRGFFGAAMRMTLAVGKDIGRRVLQLALLPILARVGRCEAFKP